LWQDAVFLDVNDYKSKIRMKDSFSAIILTFNEEKNIKACLESLLPLNIEIFIVDSGSTDNTLEICRKYTSNLYNHPFTNYSIQRNWALNNLPIMSNWVLNLDADHRVTNELATELLSTFSQPINPYTNGFLVSRRTIFMGKWIKHGGQYPTYHAILFRKGFGQCEDKAYDQHFKVAGNTKLLKNDIIDIITDSLNTFISRHNNWATLEAQYYFSNLSIDVSNNRVVKAKYFGNPIERRRFIKKKYESFPLFVRPVVYFFIRYVLRFGFLDGREGLIFHFLQGFWFRFLIDAKIYEYKKPEINRNRNKRSWFLFHFFTLFVFFYYANILFFRLTIPGPHYVEFLAEKLNYIKGLRWLLLNATDGLLHLMGFSAICSNYVLLVAGRGRIQVVYGCLGLGLCSFFVAFVMAYPAKLKAKILFIFTGIILIEFLNILRFILVVLFWKPAGHLSLDHHTVFNIILYVIIAITLYLWMKSADKENNNYGTN
jgi:exosortase/archaeosortase family protein